MSCTTGIARRRVAALSAAVLLLSACTGSSDSVSTVGSDGSAEEALDSLTTENAPATAGPSTKPSPGAAGETTERVAEVSSNSNAPAAPTTTRLASGKPSKTTTTTELVTNDTTVTGLGGPDGTGTDDPGTTPPPTTIAPTTTNRPTTTTDRPTTTTIGGTTTTVRPTTTTRATTTTAPVSLNLVVPLAWSLPDGAFSVEVQGPTGTTLKATPSNVCSIASGTSVNAIGEGPCRVEATAPSGATKSATISLRKGIPDITWSFGPAIPISFAPRDAGIRSNSDGSITLEPATLDICELKEGKVLTTWYSRACSIDATVQATSKWAARTVRLSTNVTEATIAALFGGWSQTGSTVSVTMTMTQSDASLDHEIALRLDGMCDGVAVRSPKEYNYVTDARTVTASLTLVETSCKITARLTYVGTLSGRKGKAEESKEFTGPGPAVTTPPAGSAPPAAPPAT